MDQPTRAIVDYIGSVDYASIPPSATHAVTRNFVDTVACMAAGCDDRAARAARAYARTATGTPAASALGVAGPVLLNGAVLANGAAIRQGEFHDDEQTRPPRSPIAPALFALAEAAGATPAQFIEAVFLGYQLAVALSDEAPLPATGFAQSLHISISVAAGAAKLLALDADQRANAIAIAITPSLPMGVPEHQPGAAWGPIASAQAAMTALFAARLAGAGITGPPHIFDGTEALWDTVTGAFELTGIDRAHTSLTAPERIAHRSYPASRRSQGPLRLLLELLDDGPSADVEAITIEVADQAPRAGAAAPPRTWRAEDAYYSLPYLAARAVLDRDISAATYTPERLDDPRLAQTLPRISVVEAPDLAGPEQPGHGEPARVTVRWNDGRERSLVQVYPRGHARNPLSDAELSAKFDASAAGRLSPKLLDELRTRLWNLPGEPGLGPIAALWRRFPVASPDHDKERP
jgi:2-methylcitrate dehydratase